MNWLVPLLGVLYLLIMLGMVYLFYRADEKDRKK